MRLQDDNLAVILLAGGEATRLPGKLQLDVRGVSLLEHVARNAAAIGKIYLSARAPLPPSLPARLSCDIIPDRPGAAGPLGGLLSAAGAIEETHFVALAGDMPFFGVCEAAELLCAYEPAVEGVVPVDGAARVHPLCALYDRRAFMYAGKAALRAGQTSMRGVLQRMAIKSITLRNPQALFNVNTPADREVLLECTAVPTR